MFTDQSEFDVRCEWGEHGVAALAPISDVVIVIDVLSFCTCVDIATARGAHVYPFAWKDERSKAFADSMHARLAVGRGGAGYSLSPASLVSIEPRTRLVLPSPNGSALTQLTGKTPTFAGCLRNASAVARAAMSIGRTIAVIPAGERWPDHSLRPAIEDWLGAGAIIAALDGRKSPEAQLAADTFTAAKGDLSGVIHACSSGKELIERGFGPDVELACARDCSDAAPVFTGDRFMTRTIGY
jgi:2-phosphosulfolactate phosphatase